MLKVSGGVGLSQLLMTPSAAAALQQRLEHIDKNADETSSSNCHRGAVRSIMTLLLLCLGPRSSLVSGSPLGGLDEEEAAALLAKSAGVSYYNPEILARTQAGSRIREFNIHIRY